MGVDRVSGGAHGEAGQAWGRDGAMDEGLHLWVYILRCADRSYYVGSTRKDHPAEREWEHNQGVVAGYTRSRRPVTLIYAEYYERLVEGFERERQLKRWSRAKKEALMREDWAELAVLARGKRQA